MSRMKETLDEYDDERRSDPSIFTHRQAHELEYKCMKIGAVSMRRVLQRNLLLKSNPFM